MKSNSFRRAPAAMLPLAAALTLASGFSTARASPNSYEVVHNFTGTLFDKATGKPVGMHDGCEPQASLNQDSAGNLYGTAASCGLGGNGSIFKIAPGGVFTTIISLAPRKNMANVLAYPESSLVADNAGNLYGADVAGGSLGLGSVFELSPTGKVKALHDFGPLPDGRYPYANIIRDSAGNWYGTTSQGGASNNNGTVFKVAPDGTETVLHSFSGAPDGSYPMAGLILDKSGNLYGTTESGGTGTGCVSSPPGCGTVFKITPGGNETVFYSFKGGNDGVLPFSGSLITDGAGSLYGTTIRGGPHGTGTVFKLTTSGVESVLYSFPETMRGIFPFGGVIADDAGNLYGTTYGGGIIANGQGYGVVFKLAPDGIETVLHSFQSFRKDGFGSRAGLLLSKDGYLYGTTDEGGYTHIPPNENSQCGSNCGIIFKLKP